ncbi:hypothetical protein NDU88_000138 [Pleurodeles waltl]|uniref:Uncharacterized protein n=1 Tax=Pleurodeles waltl TaxID=8319 RepID=A0AAV7KNG1_PLEWA|nr:hypothetical protein NDU88_000138 [Pleurodeles waltl]
MGGTDRWGGCTLFYAAGAFILTPPEHSTPAEDEEYFGDEPPFFDETLAGALDNTVQLSINKALERALGPLTVHFEKFARQKGWLPPIASSEETLSDQPSTSKGKAKAKSWAHSDIFRKLASSIQKEHGYSSSQAQEAYGSDLDQSSSKSSSGSDSEEDLGPRPGAGKRKKSESTKAPPTKAPKVWIRVEIIRPKNVQIGMVSSVSFPGILSLDVGSCFV